MPAKADDVIAFSCTSAGIERGSHAGTRRWPANVNRVATAGCVLISERSCSSASRHCTRIAEIEGVLNTSAKAPVIVTESKQKAVNQRESRVTAFLFNAAPQGGLRKSSAPAQSLARST